MQGAREAVGASWLGEVGDQEFGEAVAEEAVAFGPWMHVVGVQGPGFVHGEYVAAVDDAYAGVGPGGEFDTGSYVVQRQTERVRLALELGCRQRGDDDERGLGMTRAHGCDERLDLAG